MGRACRSGCRRARCRAGSGSPALARVNTVPLMLVVPRLRSGNLRAERARRVADVRACERRTPGGRRQVAAIDLAAAPVADHAAVLSRWPSCIAWACKRPSRAERAAHVRRTGAAARETAGAAAAIQRAAAAVADDAAELAGGRRAAGSAVQAPESRGEPQRFGVPAPPHVCDPAHPPQSI